VDNPPAQIRQRFALRLLSLSPNYFYDPDIQAEDQRNRRSRPALARTLLLPHVTETSQVLDYSPGPGYMACVVAEWAGHVLAADIARGVLVGAKTLNGRANISYLRSAQLAHPSDTVDFAYSLTLVQHLSGEALAALAHRRPQAREPACR
jgi:hypothetical protein